MMSSDIICLSETWIACLDDANILHNFSSNICGSGKEKGVAKYYRSQFSFLQSKHIEKPGFQILHLEFDSFYIIAVYLSQTEKPYADVASELDLLISAHADKLCVICGDFNLSDYLSSVHNIIETMLSRMGYQQVIISATHFQGSLLTQVYKNQEPEEQFIHSVYYSDHDATCPIHRLF